MLDLQLYFDDKVSFRTQPNAEDESSYIYNEASTSYKLRHPIQVFCYQIQLTMYIQIDPSTHSHPTSPTTNKLNNEKEVKKNTARPSCNDKK